MLERCVVCRQGQASEVVGLGELHFVLEDDRRMRCARCGGEYYTGEQADERQRKVERHRV